MSEQRKCVVCGANVTKSRIRREEYPANCNTCDPICTRARDAGRTRQEQFWADDEEDQRLTEQGEQPRYHRLYEDEEGIPT